MLKNKLGKLGYYLAKIIPQGINHVLISDNKLVITVEKEQLRKVIKFFFRSMLFKMDCLMDVWGVDLIGKEERFEVNYLLLSIKYNYRIIIKVKVNEVDCVVPTVSDIYGSAEWLEREVWDMFGVFFEGHKDLRRILSDYGFKGHPLRKDYPLSGYSEIRYDEGQKRIVEEPLELSQEYRTFNFESPWEKKNKKR